MSKTVAFIFSFLILTQSFNIGLEDISKLQTLIEHAQFHNKMYGDSFFDFISEHYGDQMFEHQNKHSEHQKLPFKDAQHLSSHMNTTFLNETVVFDFEYIEFAEIPFNFHYKDSFTKFEKRSVFQPPKYV